MFHFKLSQELKQILQKAKPKTSQVCRTNPNQVLSLVFTRVKIFYFFPLIVLRFISKGLHLLSFELCDQESISSEKQLFFYCHNFHVIELFFNYAFLSDSTGTELRNLWPALACWAADWSRARSGRLHRNAGLRHVWRLVWSSSRAHDLRPAIWPPCFFLSFSWGVTREFKVSGFTKTIWDESKIFPTARQKT